MTISVALNHVTHYRYSRPVAMGMQTIRLRPAPHTHSAIASYSLTVTPPEHFLNWQQDPFGNYLARVVFPEKVSEMRVEVNLVAEIRVYNPLDFFLEPYARDFPFAYEAALKEELTPYLEIKEAGAELMKLLAGVSRETRNVVDFLSAINQRIYGSLHYLIRMEQGVQSCEETLTSGSGSCRDMTWLLCQLLRHLGFATRFASGYLIQLKPDVKPLDGPAGPESDFTDLHAWTEVYLPGAGWIGLDPTSGLFTGEGHIPLCCTPSPGSAAPISGTLEPSETRFEFHMAIERIEETPRVTQPYTQAQWQAIDAVGALVDEQLAAGDVRLTMGGEPTFISDEDRTGDEWHYTALSERKKDLGQELFLKLKNQFAPSGLLQYTQGKWYPGEILPRWAMQCIWRKDGEPLWKRAALLEPAGKLPPDSDKQFIDKLAAALGISPGYILPAYEDGEYYAWKAKTMPLAEKVKDDAFETMERERLQALGDRLASPSGYVLPLFFSRTRKSWISNPWRFKTERLTLIPGDSPVGLRLPLSSLPFVAQGEAEYFPERGTGEQNGELPVHAALMEQVERRLQARASEAFAKDPVGLIHSALCAQLRNGILYVFLPPVSYIEHFLDLSASLETVAAALNLPLVLEGYPPPADRRMEQFSVTPDPGVIEINVQPARDWQELKAITHAVYDQARATKLSAEKFLLDGRRTGTGGGNHIVVGSGLVADSPFLRRPELLQSMLAFWQNHPSLSYLFSSLYIGPTSQSPRIDEARHDALYELEIAFQSLKTKGKALEPALIDRLFRHILVDLTGNTHRAEFCIDKLFSPDSSRGKLGLLELRAFEMTPHPQMNLLQGLLIRAAIAQFWQMPYRHKLIRWGTVLHDKFMLPAYLREDLHDVLRHLNQSGYGFKPEWFEPFFAFRFPLCGKVKAGPVTLELHMALEPWPVLGEEMNAGSVSRSVDSSLERLQVTLRGQEGGRYAVLCNARRLPLAETAEQEVSVGAVRYKAWALPSSMNPTIPVHAPLVFDVVDTHAGMSLGGAAYHVTHPGGRNYETVPVNENEAEGRRLSRFDPHRHNAGILTIPPAETNPDFPHTLDLRFEA